LLNAAPSAPDAFVSSCRTVSTGCCGSRMITWSPEPKLLAEVSSSPVCCAELLNDADAERTAAISCLA
jgi:hypothetical protein